MQPVKQDYLIVYNNKCASLNDIPKEIIVDIVMRCLENMKNVKALANTNHKLYQIIKPLLFNPKISVFCPKLTFVDTTMADTIMSHSINAQLPRCNTYRLIEAYHTLAPLVEGDKGVSFVTMVEGRTKLTLDYIARMRGCTIKNSAAISRDIPCLAVPETYNLLITNNVTIGSRWQTADGQSANIQKMGDKLRLPTCEELLTLCIFTDNKDCYSNDPPTVGRTSTLTNQGQTVTVGGNNTKSITIAIFPQNEATPNIGAGACRRL